MDDTPAEMLEPQGASPFVADDAREWPDSGDDPELDDFPDEPELSDAEQMANLRRGMADFEAGRYRPAKDVLRELAAEDGITLPE